MGNKASKSPDLAQLSYQKNKQLSPSITAVVQRRSKKAGGFCKGVRPASLAIPAGTTKNLAESLVRPVSVQSVPSSTMDSDTRLVINQLCAKRPKYCLLKQINIDQLDDRIQFLLFESVCDLIDQLGTIERLTLEKPIVKKTGSATEDISLHAIVADYRSLAAGFIANVAPELVARNYSNPDVSDKAAIYSPIHSVMSAMLKRAVELKAEKTDALLLELAKASSIERRHQDKEHNHEQHEGLFDLSLRREIERLLDRTSARLGSTLVAEILPPRTDLREMLAFASMEMKCTAEFVDAFALWCWRAVCCCWCSTSGSISGVLDLFPSAASATSGSVVGGIRFNPNLHSTIVERDRPGCCQVDCIVWPALIRRSDGVRSLAADKRRPSFAVLSKAMVKLRVV